MWTFPSMTKGHGLTWAFPAMVKGHGLKWTRTTDLTLIRRAL